MRYYLIAGEASGDLHASRLMRELKSADPQAEFRFVGGDLMAAECGRAPLIHYRHLAYMGLLPVLMHLPAILRGMKLCRQDIQRFSATNVILVDYAGFNLRLARTLSRESKVLISYYILPKVWAWKEGRLSKLAAYTHQLLSILPFEPEWFASRGVTVTYVGNPTAQEIAEHLASRLPSRQPSSTRLPIIALLPGSRRQEIKLNLPVMLRACQRAGQGYRVVVAGAPGVPREFYTQFHAPEIEWGDTYGLLGRATAALVTSGTATLETALLGVPQVVCYGMVWGRLANWGQRLLLKIPYISLVNLICGKAVVPELVAADMNVANVARHLRDILPGGALRQTQLDGYAQLRQQLGQDSAPRRAAQAIIELAASRASSGYGSTATGEGCGECCPPTAGHNAR